MEAHLHIEAGLGRRLGEEPEVYIGKGLIFLSSRFIGKLLGRRHRSEGARFGRSAQAKPEYGLVQGIQFLQERCLLYDDSGICFGECRRSREHERGRKNERGLLIIHHFHPLPLKFHVNGGFNNKL